MPYVGQGLDQGTRQRHTFTATANQTTFAVAYSPKFVDVFQNGILLAPSDYTATNGTTVVLAVGAALNDEITIITQHLFAVADTVSATQGGTFSGNVTVTGNLTVQGSTITVDNATTQTVDLGDNDKIRLGADNDLQIYHTGTTAYIDNTTGDMTFTNTDTGVFSFDGNLFIKGDDGNNKVRTFTASNGVVLGLGENTGSADLIRLDARSTTPNVSYFNAGNVGIGTDNPVEKLEVNGVIQIRTAASTHPAMRFMEASDTRGYFGAGDWAVNGLADADFGISSGSGGKLVLGTGAGTARMTIDGSGHVGIGSTSPAGIHSLAKVLEISGGDGGDLIIGNNSSANIGAGAHIGAIAFKNIDSSIGTAPHYAGIRSESVDTSGNMDLRFYTGTGNLEADTPQVYVSSGGNVGVGGQTSPLAKLDIKGDTSTFDGMSKIYLTDTSSNAGSRNWSLGNGGSGFGNLTFAVSAAKDGNAGDATATNAMVITGNGYMTTPSQPSFDVWGPNSNAGFYMIDGTNTTYTNWSVGNSVSHNTGNHFNTTTGIFTAPIAGRYFFNLQVMFRMHTGTYINDLLFTIQKNGSTYVQTDCGFNDDGNGDGWNTDNCTAIIDLAANDTAQATYALYSSTHGTGAQTNWYSYHGYYTRFCGHLLG